MNLCYKMQLKVFLLLFNIFCMVSSQPKTHFTADGEHHSQFDRDVLLSDEDNPRTLVNDLTPEEQREKLKYLVEQKIDTDHDGQVSRPELQVWALKAFNMFETEETRREFPTYDDDEDSKVSWVEYAESSFGDDFNEDSEEYKNPPDSDEWRSFIQSYKTEKKLFKAADQDGDGSLDENEFITFKHPRYSEETKAIWIEDMLEKADTDRDGGINLEEFLGEFRKMSQDDNDPDWVLVETDKFKEELDVDKDGLLMGDEIANWLASDNQLESEEEAEHIIGECDTDGDSRLTLEEILDNKDMWIESDVTDYGNLLTNHDEL